MASAARILLTGRPGVGKTTIVRRFLETGPAVAGGFLTEEIRRGGRRVGFAVRDVHSGREGILAAADRRQGPRVGRYRVDLASFESVGVGALRQAMAREGCVVIDEIGKMEAFSQGFRAAVTELFDSGRAFLASIAVHDHPFLNGLRERPGVTLIEALRENRDALPARLVEMLIAAGRHEDRPTG